MTDKEQLGHQPAELVDAQEPVEFDSNNLVGMVDVINAVEDASAQQIDVLNKNFNSVLAELKALSNINRQSIIHKAEQSTPSDTAENTPKTGLFNAEIKQENAVKPAIAISSDAPLTEPANNPAIKSEKKAKNKPKYSENLARANIDPLAPIRTKQDAFLISEQSAVPKSPEIKPNFYTDSHGRLRHESGRFASKEESSTYHSELSDSDSEIKEPLLKITKILTSLDATNKAFSFMNPGKNLNHDVSMAAGGSFVVAAGEIADSVSALKEQVSADDNGQSIGLAGKAKTEAKSEEVKKTDGKLEQISKVLGTIASTQKALNFMGRTDLTRDTGMAAGGSFFVAAAEISDTISSVQQKLDEANIKSFADAKVALKNKVAGTKAVIGKLIGRAPKPGNDEAKATEKQASNSNKQIKLLGRIAKLLTPKKDRTDDEIKATESVKGEVKKVVRAVKSIDLSASAGGNDNNPLDMFGDDDDKKRDRHRHGHQTKKRGFFGRLKDKVGGKLGRFGGKAGKIGGTAAMAGDLLTGGLPSLSSIGDTVSSIGGKGGMWGKVADVGGSVLGGAGRLLSKAAIPLAIASSVYDGVTGYNDTEKQRETFGLKENEKPTTAQKLSSAAGSVLSLGGLTDLIGLDSGTISKALYSGYTYFAGDEKAGGSNQEKLAADAPRGDAASKPVTGIAQAQQYSALAAPIVEPVLSKMPPSSTAVSKSQSSSAIPVPSTIPKPSGVLSGANAQQQKEVLNLLKQIAANTQKTNKSTKSSSAGPSIPRGFSDPNFAAFGRDQA